MGHCSKLSTTMPGWTWYSMCIFLTFLFSYLHLSGCRSHNRQTSNRVPVRSDVHIGWSHILHTVCKVRHDTAIYGWDKIVDRYFYNFKLKIWKIFFVVQKKSLSSFNYCWKLYLRPQWECLIEQKENMLLDADYKDFNIFKIWLKKVLKIYLQKVKLLT